MTVQSMLNYWQNIPIYGLPFALELIFALALDWLLGGFAFLNAAKLISSFTSGLEKLFFKKLIGKPSLNKAQDEKIYGIWVVIIVVLTCMFLGWAIPFGASYFGPIAASIARIILLFFAFGTRSLCSKSLKVAKAVAKDDKDGARKAVSYMASRDCDKLSMQGVARSACESIAVNMSRVVIAPLFYALVGQNMFFGIGGVTLVWGYVAAEVVCGKIGIDNAKYINFGFAAKKVSDVFGIFPSRLTALGITLGAFLLGKNGKRSFALTMNESSNCMDINSGWPIAALSGTLGIKMGGGAYYNGMWKEAPTIGFDAKSPEAADIKAALVLLPICQSACLLLGIISTSILTFVAVIISFYEMYKRIKRIGGGRFR